ncbi:hypothetical protein H7846_14145 [Edaphobacter sp. 4G125]|nr:hypothetical protein H7846_14145 [Edaphobacter sp. 4G125]
MREDDLVASGDGTVRGTQSFVHTLSECWSRPSLTLLEVLWRWIYGIPALLLVWHVAKGILSTVSLNTAALKTMTVTDPLQASETLAEAMAVLLPPVSRVAIWLVPLLLVTWVIWSSIGRTIVLRRADNRLHARVGTMILLQAIRVIALAGSFLLWFLCLQWYAQRTVTGPMTRGAEPNLVGYFALSILTTLGLFTLWAIVSWFLSIAPLLAMLCNLGAGSSLTASFRLGPLKSKLVEVNLVMGIVKIALLVLAMVFSATPLPFESIATQDFLNVWWTIVALLYFIASDFFHVARAVAYLKFWRAYESPAEAATEI